MAANPVYIDFIVRNIPNVQRAFRSVADAALAAERSQTNKAKTESDKRVAQANREAREKIAAMKKADKWHDQALNKAERDTKRATDTAAREARRAAQEKIRAMQLADKWREQAITKAERDAKRAADAEIREQKRVANEKKKVSQADFVRERDEFRNRRRLASHLGGAFVGGLTNGASRVVGLAGRAAGLVGQLGGGFDIASSVQRNAKNAGDTADLINSGINTFSKNEKNRTRRSEADVNGALDVSTMSYGIQRSDAIGGLRAYTSKTGDLDSGLKLLPQLAEMSRATGTNFEELAGAAGQLGVALENIQDPAKKADAIMQALRTAGAQGKAGTVELSDMAVQMAKLVAVSNKFEGDNVENLAKMGMLAQFAAGGGGAWSASSATTSVSSFGSVFGKEARVNQFLGKGINPFSDAKHTKLKAPEEIIADAFEKTGGDQIQIQKLFGSSMGMRAVNKFGTAFHDGYKGVDGKQYKGREAVVKMAKDMTSTTMSKGDVSAAASARMQQLDAKMAQVQEKFDAAVREKIIPTLLDLVPEFEKLAKIMPELVGTALPQFVNLLKTLGEFAQSNQGFLKFFASNAIETVVLASLGRSLGSAVVAEGAKLAISKAMGDAGLGAVVGKLGGSLGMLASAAGIAAAAWLAIKLGEDAIDKEYATSDAIRQTGRVDESQAAGLLGRIKSGRATDKDRADAQALVGKLSGDIGAIQSDYANPGVAKSIGRGLGGVFTPEATATADKEEAAAVRTQLTDMTTTMQRLAEALRDNTGATKGNTAGTTSSGPNGAARHQPIVQRNGVK